MNKLAEQKAIELLFNIAQRQQQIINRLAAIVGGDPNIEYLLSAIPTAAANAGANNVVVSRVDPKPGGTADSGAQMMSGYTAYVKGIPSAPKLREVFTMTWEKQLAAQKPDLVGRVSIMFED